MQMELLKEKINFDVQKTQQVVQSIVEGDIIVPDVKPDVLNILQVNGELQVPDVEINEGRINYRGNFEYNILYMCDDISKSVHNIVGVLDINDFINVDGIDDKMTVNVEHDIEYIEFNLINSRKINIKAIIKTTAYVNELIENEVVSDIGGIEDVQILKKPIETNKIVENKEEKVTVKEVFNVPTGKPNVDNILKSNIKISNKDIKLLDGKLSIKGDLNVAILYNGEDRESEIDFVEYELPFNQIIDDINCQENMYSDVKIQIVEKKLNVVEDEDGEKRTFELDLELVVKLKVINVELIEVIEDAYSIGRQLELQKQKVKYQKLLYQNKNQCIIKEMINIEDNNPNVLQIYTVDGKVKVEEMEVLENRVIVEGIITTKILYIVADDESPIYSYEKDIPFVQTIDTKGSNDKMLVEVESVLEHVGFNMLSQNEIELRFIICFNTKVMDQKELDMIINVEENEHDKKGLEHIASINIYMCKTGDTLWNIAKRYNTTVEDIASMNDIEDINKIYVGQKLLIVKKISE